MLGIGNTAIEKQDWTRAVLKSTVLLVKDWTARMQQQARVFLVTNMSKQTVVCGKARLARSGFDRMRGLLGVHQLETGSGLWLRPSSGVHTWGMRFAIDIIALDKRNRVVAVAAETTPWRMRGVHWRTRSVLELSCGQAALSKIETGDHIQFDEQESS